MAYGVCAFSLMFGSELTSAALVWPYLRSTAAICLVFPHGLKGLPRESGVRPLRPQNLTCDVPHRCDLPFQGDGQALAHHGVCAFNLVILAVNLHFICVVPYLWSTLRVVVLDFLLDLEVQPNKMPNFSDQESHLWHSSRMQSSTLRVVDQL